MSTYDAILFDLDGTLIDSREGITKSLQYALSQFCIHEDNTHRLSSFIGLPLLEIFQNFYSFDGPKAHQAIEFYREHFTESGMYENFAYPEIPELLAHLHHNKKKLAIATVKPTLFAEKIVMHLGIHDSIDFVEGGNLDETGPSKTEIIRHILQKLSRTPKQNIIMVGDRERDIDGAHRNGIHSIAVAYGYGSMEELQRARPTYFAHSVEELGLLLKG